MSLPDPRFTTRYEQDHRGPWFHQNRGCSPLPTLTLPSSTQEVWCEPGYQSKRPNKGVMLTVNDYPFHPIQYTGSLWPSVVHTPEEWKK